MRSYRQWFAGTSGFAGICAVLLFTIPESDAPVRTTETVDAAFGSALHEVTSEEIAGWFWDRAAYAMQP